MVYSISGPVGPWEDKVIVEKKGNQQKDVKAVQTLLIAASDKLGKAEYNPGTPDGKIAKAPKQSATLDAIAAFQRRFLGTPDRRVDVGGTTWRKLSQYAPKGPPVLLCLEGAKLIAFCQAMMDGHCSYGFGKKARPLSTAPADVSRIDCSGFVRYLLYQVTDRRVTIPDGSWNQDAWFRGNNFQQVDYADTAKHDGVLRLGYFSGSPGHIWFVRNGKTLESHGSKGPNRRKWDTGVLKKNVKRCYVVAMVTAVVDAKCVLV